MSPFHANGYTSLFEMSDAAASSAAARRAAAVGSGAHQRAQTAAATGGVSRLASRTGLAAWGAQTRSTGPPRVLGTQERSDKQRYAQRWNRALLAEAIDAAAATKQRIGALTPAALARDGLALFGLAARAVGWLFADFAYELVPRDGGALPYHRFQVGDCVFVSRGGVSAGEVYEGSVMTRTRTRLVVTTTTPIRACTTGVWVCCRTFSFCSCSLTLFMFLLLFSSSPCLPAETGSW